MKGYQKVLEKRYLSTFPSLAKATIKSQEKQAVYDFSRFLKKFSEFNIKEKNTEYAIQWPKQKLNTSTVISCLMIFVKEKFKC